jgi:hypothetical protein
MNDFTLDGFFSFFFDGGSWIIILLALGFWRLGVIVQRCQMRRRIREQFKDY